MTGVSAVLSRSLPRLHALPSCGAFAEGRRHGRRRRCGLPRLAEHPYSRVIALLGRWLSVSPPGGRCPRPSRCSNGPRPLRRLRTSGSSSHGRCRLGAAYALAGRAAEALPLLEQAVEQAMAMRAMVDQALRSSGSARRICWPAAWTRRTPGAARPGARPAHQERGHEAYALRLLGEILRTHDPPEVEQAEAHYRQALALAEELGMRPLQAHCHRGLGTLYATTGQREQARTALSTAIEMYRAMEMTFWLPETEAALAQVEGR